MNIPPNVLCMHIATVWMLLEAPQEGLDPALRPFPLPQGCAKVGVS